jgi:hypothetical protein
VVPPGFFLDDVPAERTRPGTDGGAFAAARKSPDGSPSYGSSTDVFGFSFGAPVDCLNVCAVKPCRV